MKEEYDRKIKMFIEDIVPLVIERQNVSRVEAERIGAQIASVFSVAAVADTLMNDAENFKSKTLAVGDAIMSCVTSILEDIDIDDDVKHFVFKMVVDTTAIGEHVDELREESRKSSERERIRREGDNG